MNNNIVTEIVSFDIDESIANEMFEEIVDSLEKEFHRLQSGYIDSELVKGEKFMVNDHALGVIRRS